MKLAALFACLALAAPAVAEDGTLVIAGGALRSDNEEVHRAFLDAAGGADEARVAIVPVASGYPSGSAQSFAETLQQYGVDPARIEIVRLAMIDDPETPELDESGWAGNAADPDEIARIETADAIWFTGGDQARIVDALVQDDGSDTPMLAAMRARLDAGAVIGGTSAGAAMMSPVMIARGETLPALLEPVTVLDPGQPAPETERLVLSAGLGFFPYGLTDQHFGERARLGRLARASAMAPDGLRFGFGVDENTALVVDLETHTLAVLGEGAVTVIDAREAALETVAGAARIEGLLVHVLDAGDRLDLASGALEAAAYKSATRGREYYDRADTGGGGMAVASGALADLLGEALLDNAGASRIERLSFSGARGVVYRFNQLADSEGFWGRDAAGAGRYSIAEVAFDIHPVAISVTPLEPEG